MLRKSHAVLAANLALGIWTCVSALPGTQALTGNPSGARTSPQGQERPVLASATIKDAKGRAIGWFQIDRDTAASSWVTVRVRGLTPGFHGFHIHSAGVCDAASTDPATGSPFSSAGGHLDAGHGADASGNLPSLLAARDGVASAGFRTDRFTAARLADADGSAVIVHAGPDNFANIPSRYRHPKDATGTSGPDVATLKTGDAGRRVGCGIIHLAG
ncbi:superoxide dismutase family protein [Microbispora sp. RL4-1S]|uniref:Superoxide dismutase [Cu-Zn] n=1 Tax=Microbispora oryzae TaxID=2806554 RepID=A0A941AIL6_9ACTN|nr:superoxide dismutase family protein [Microbispora oryzae]MBP2703258.1 superoxide dismutase family protein [Microbispora oryzae]